MSILMTILPSSFLLHKINQFIQAWEEKFSLNYGLFLLSWKSGLRVSEAVSFDYRLKHPRHKDLYLVHGKGQRNRYVYVSSQVISELKTNHWKPNQTNRISFYHFLQKTKKELNIGSEIELTPHTLRRCFTTHNALNGIPMPILQKFLGHANIRTTSGYWKGSVDIREFGGWLEPDSDLRKPEEVPKVKVGDNPQLPKTPQIPLKLESPNSNKEPKLLKTIEKLKGELAEKNLIIAKKGQQLKIRDSEISLLTNENKKLKAINQQKDQQLAEYKEKLKELTEENNSLLQNYTNLKTSAENTDKNLTNNNQILTEPSQEKNNRKILLNSRENSPNTLLKIKEPPNNLLAVKEKEPELSAQIQVWKPPN